VKKNVFQFFQFSIKKLGVRVILE